MDRESKLTRTALGGAHMEANVADDVKSAETQSRPVSAAGNVPALLVIDDDPVQRMTMGKVGSKATP